MAILQLVGFRVGDGRFALDIRSIVQVLFPVESTRLPEAPVFIEGIIQLRNLVVPLVDLRKRFGSPVTEAKSNRILVTRVGAPDSDLSHAPFLGLFVDEVLRVIQVEEKELLQASELLTSGEPAYTGQVYRDDDKLFVLLAPERILTSGESEELESSQLAG